MLFALFVSLWPPDFITILPFLRHRPIVGNRESVGDMSGPENYKASQGEQAHEIGSCMPAEDSILKRVVVWT